MKKAFLMAFGVIIISGVMIFGANAFEKGENRIDNSTFEVDKVGENPQGWQIDEYG